MWRYIILVISLITLLSMYVYKKNSNDYELYLWESDEYSKVGKKELTQFYYNNIEVDDIKTSNTSTQRGGWFSIFNEKARDDESIWPNSNKINKHNISSYIITKTQIKPQLSLIGVIESKNVETIISPANTRVLSVNVTAGNKIKKGDSLFLLDNKDYALRLKQQQNNLNQSKLNLKNSINELDNNNALLDELKNDLKNELRLYNDGLSKLKRVTELKKNIKRMIRDISIYNENKILKTSVYEYEKKQYNYVVEQYKHYQVTAPFDAEVLAVYVAPDQLLNSGQNIIKLVKDNSKMVSAKISIKTRNKINNDQSSIDYIIKNNEIINLNNKIISNESNNGLLNIQFELNEKNNLIIGESVELIIELDSVQGLLVPNTAIYENKYVYIVNGDSIYKQEITQKGYRLVNGEQWTLIASDNISTGDAVMVTKLVQPFDGAKVSVLSVINEVGLAKNE
ncbi:MAG: biotin/lipoyl-binding protein [Saccharospirillaceae bacterium]|nr:efflux RND transporter periplasmic adaptor subunit [Pseudomonadales bacterium]NRB78738.1 biotin/lipoyl-binding protein [Saccharospirillaceae bacterium]